MLLLASLAFAAGAVADMATTRAALRRKGLREGNPLMAATGNPVLVAGLINAATLAVVLVAVALQPAAQTTALWFLGVAAAWRWGTAIWNYRQIRKHTGESNAR